MHHPKSLNSRNYGNLLRDAEVFVHQLQRSLGPLGFIPGNMLGIPGTPKLKPV